MTVTRVLGVVTRFVVCLLVPAYLSLSALTSTTSSDQASWSVESGEILLTGLRQVVLHLGDGEQHQGMAQVLGGHQLCRHPRDYPLQPQHHPSSRSPQDSLHLLVSPAWTP